MPARASIAATMPPCAAQPGCSDFTDEPLVRNSMTPEAWLSAMPSAATVRSSSRRISSPASSATASVPVTEVLMKPFAWKPFGAARPKRISTSQPRA
jgi:hypothetical protein